MKLEEIQGRLDEIGKASPIEECDGLCLPNRKEVVDLLKDLQSLLFPGYFKSRSVTQEGLSGLSLLRKIENELVTLLEKAGCANGNAPEAKECTAAFLSRLPQVKTLLLKDIQALYEGDPAAKSHKEVLLCYPAFTPFPFTVWLTSSTA